jgi:ubiquinone/menaquinone biosynthesis C-methylase UbiE
MTDPYSFIAEVEQSVQVRLADVLELRAADPQQRAMVERYLAEVHLPRGARALEVGCGTGAISRRIAESFEAIEVIGLDPSPVFMEKAREFAKDISNASFCLGDGRALEFPDESFDLVVFHTTLCHIPGAQKAVREAFRVLRAEGWLAAFDGDYSTTSVALRDFDPLQSTVETMIANFVHDRWLIRGLPKMLSIEGFEVMSCQSHGYLQTTEPTYMLTVVDRGADLLAATGSLGVEAAEGLKKEARRRVAEREFFGHISFASVIARKFDQRSRRPAVA